MIIAGIVGIAVGYIAAKADLDLCKYKGKQSQPKHLEDIILWIAGGIVFFSIVLMAIGKMSEQISGITINVFGTMIFSWLLTKKSAKKEFKEHEEETALKSYRHINYIDTAANTAYKEIESYIDGVTDVETKLILGKALDHIKYVQGGISTCKLDWFDMLSEQDKGSFKEEMENEQNQEEFGVVRINISGMPVNQEDA